MRYENAVDSYYDDCDLVIKAAAVADYRSAKPAKDKIKERSYAYIESGKNPDILYELGKRKTHQTLVGFAAETTNVIEYGQGKLKRRTSTCLLPTMCPPQVLV